MENCSSNQGGCIYVSNGLQIKILNTSFSFAQSYKGAIIFVNEIQQLIMQNNSIKNCVTEQGIIYLKNQMQNSQLWFQDIYLCKNSAKHGNFIYAQSRTNLNIENIMIQSSNGNVLYAEQFSLVSIKIKNMTIQNCSSVNDIIIVKQYLVDMQDIYLYNNTQNGNGLSFYKSFIQINNLCIRKIYGMFKNKFQIWLYESSGIINSLIYDNINFRNFENQLFDQNQFQDNYDQENSKIIGGFYSNLSLIDSKCIGIQSHEQSLVYLQNSQITIQYSIFSKCKGYVINLEDSNGFINNSVFQQNQGFDIFAVKKLFGIREKKLNLTIQNSVFNSSNFMIKIIYFDYFDLIKCKFMSIEKSKGIISQQVSNSFFNDLTVTNLQAIQGAFLESECLKKCDLSIQNSHFIHCTADQGGVFYFNGLIDFISKMNHFEKNQALNGSGGVLTNNCFSCQININQNIFVKIKIEQIISSDNFISKYNKNFILKIIFLINIGNSRFYVKFSHSFRDQVSKLKKNEAYQFYLVNYNFN